MLTCLLFVDLVVAPRLSWAAWIRDEGEGPLASTSDWVLLARNGKILDLPHIVEATTPIHEHPDWRLWTDDFNNLVQVLKD